LLEIDNSPISFPISVSGWLWSFGTAPLLGFRVDVFPLWLLILVFWALVQCLLLNLLGSLFLFVIDAVERKRERQKKEKKKRKQSKQAKQERKHDRLRREVQEAAQILFGPWDCPAAGVGVRRTSLCSKTASRPGSYSWFFSRRKRLAKTGKRKEEEAEKKHKKKKRKEKKRKEKKKEKEKRKKKKEKRKKKKKKEKRKKEKEKEKDKDEQRLETAGEIP